MSKEHLVNIKLSEIKPNPNRDLKFNPYNEEKITALMASIGETGFWTNVIVRKSPDGKGYEQAYGHHRIEAARRSGIKEADFVVRDLDENMMLKMMELENQEDYRYCPLSLLESVKAVVNALAEGRIAPFDHTDSAGRPNPKPEHYRYAPSFVPAKVNSLKESGRPYTAVDIAKFLGRERKAGKYVGVPSNIEAAVNALYLLEVKAIKTSDIVEMNWAALGKFVADIKARRERVIIRTTKTEAEIAEINEKSRRMQIEQKERERKAAEERKALVKKLAEAKREDDEKEKKKIQARLDERDEKLEREADTFKRNQEALGVKLAQTKAQAEAAKKEDIYLPLRKETARLVSMLNCRNEAEEIKAIARKPLNVNDRKLLLDAAISKGTWYKETLADIIWKSMPKSGKEDLEESRKREEAQRRTEEKENQ